MNKKLSSPGQMESGPGFFTGFVLCDGAASSAAVNLSLEMCSEVGVGNLQRSNTSLDTILDDSRSAASNLPFLIR